jgi:hypothetical protein
MRRQVEIENIEALRLQEGIEDVELRAAIRGLRVGQCVRLTLLTGATPSAGETLLVRITHVRAGQFRGRLTSRPASARLAGLRVGSPLAFTRDHIHSIAGMGAVAPGRPARAADR